MLKFIRLRQFLAGVMVLLLALVIYVLYAIWFSMPVINKTMHGDVLESVSIVRDEYGIPSIRGKNERDIFYAQGYVHAQDRLFQMVLMKHMFLGRMSEIFGKKTIGVDRYMRYLNVENNTQTSYEALSDKTKEMLEAYAKGVNEYISEHRPSIEQRLLGFSIEPWRPEDSLVIQKAMAFDLSRDWPLIMKNTALVSQYGIKALNEVYPYEVIVEPSVLDSDLINEGLPYKSEVQEFFDGPEVPKGVVSSYEGFARLSHAVLAGLSSDESVEAGSNIWAVANTESGLPYIASDPHLSYRAPNMFYLIHIEGGEVNLTGGSIPGAPGIIIGRNKDIAWGFTNGKLAQSDIFYAKEIPNKRKRLETIQVKGGEDIIAVYYDTDYGVLISEDDSPYDVAFNWTSLQKVDVTLDAIYGFSHSKSIEELRPHIANFQTPSQNLVVADDKGNYGLFAVGQVPIRQHSGRIAVPARETYRWKNYIPHDELPRVINPERGYVMNANNDVVSRHYGYNASRLEFDNLRAVRLVKMLQAKNDFTIKDMSDIQLDNEDQKWIIMKDALMKTKPKSQQAKRVLAALSKWDGQAVRDSYEITIFSTWMHEISSMIYQDISTGLPRWAKPQYSDLFVRNSIQENGRACLLHISCEDLLSNSLEAAIKKLETQYKSKDITQWTWKHAHQAVFSHAIFKKVPLFRQLSTRKVRINGARDTLNRSRWYTNKKGFNAIEGACLRMIANLNEKSARFAVPMGESENIFSRHYDDLMPIWAEGEYLVLEREPKSVSVIELLPQK